jgi:hypothetical protein
MERTMEKKIEHKVTQTDEVKAAEFFRRIATNPKLRKVNPLCFLSDKFTDKYINEVIDHHKKSQNES